MRRTRSRSPRAAFSFVLLLFSVILIVVISIYMLLDMQRLESSIDSRFPPHGGAPLTQRIESALWGYLKGQAILSTVIGTSAGVGMYILGVTGLVEGAEEYALLFGLWTAFIEVVLYIGPWLSAVPPAIYALFADRPGRRLGRASLPLHLPGGRSHRRAERDGARGSTRCSSSSGCSQAERCTGSPAFWSRCRPWPAGARSGSSSASG